MRRPPRRCLASLAAMFGLAAAFAAGAAAQDARLTGFSAAGSAEQRVYEAALQRRIWPDTMARYAVGLSSAPHVAGTPGQAATRDSVVRWLRSAGLAIGYDSLVLYLPQPQHVSVSRLSPDPRQLTIAEPPIPDIASTASPVPVFNAYSGNGRSEGQVVYVNYGLPADYRRLDSLGVQVRGRIVVARYGRSFRGIKAREAELRGAGALLMFSDPDADGYGAGEVYPQGPFRPELGVQRGSILNSNGDPSTPDGPSLPGTERVPEAEMLGIGRIPVVPIGYGPAAELLQGLGGPEAPEDWQGGLPFTYRIGPGPVTAGVEVRTERGEEAYHPAFNTVAILPGAVWPDEWIIVGGHRDAWGPGAIDDVSGTASVVAAARAFADLAAGGDRPKRSVLFVTWDAEEWGIVGSIEWVEARADTLGASAVAYLNQDVGVSGSRFGAAASGELKALIREAAGAVREPDAAGSVFDAWLEQARRSGGEVDATVLTPPVGDLGGGSDHKGFYQHLGIPAAGFGFGGRGGVYHSMYDTPDWMGRFGDPGYEYHATVSRILAIAASRLANADVLPFDYAELARILSDQTDGLEQEIESAVAATAESQHEADRQGDLARRLRESGIAGALVRLRSAVADFRDRAERFDAIRARRLAAGDLPVDRARDINNLLRKIGPAFTSPDGVPGDRWTRQLMFASDPDNGYATLPLPGIRLALRSGAFGEVSNRIDELALAVGAAAALLSAAAEIAEG